MSDLQLVMETKACRDCHEVKSLGDFYYHAQTRDRLWATCKMCVNGRQAIYRKTPRGLIANRRRSATYQRRTRYGLTTDAYQSMLAGQLGLCASCEQPETSRTKTGDSVKSLSVDHDHETGKVRGLLCDRCNNLLGRAQDDPVILEAAARYLRRHQGGVLRK